MTGVTYPLSTPPLDHNTTFVLFLFTILIHVTTMCFLESVSHKFKQYVSATRGTNVNSKREEAHAPNTHNTTPHPPSAQCNQYKPLYSSLDVSIFR